MTKKEELSFIKLGFTADQIAEIAEGTEAGLDVSIYAKKGFFAIQMRQIRLGMMEKLPVEVYAREDYDWFQMEEIRKGLQARVNIRLYAYPTISYEKMRQIRKGLEEGINLTKYLNLDAGTLQELREAAQDGVDLLTYIEEGYEPDQLRQIRKGLAKGLDIDSYLGLEFRGVSIREMCIGLEMGLDISAYAKVEYEWRKMREIRLGLEHRVDINNYVSPFYTWKQMQEIRLGLEAGLDVSSYRSLMYTAGQMNRKRTYLLANTPGRTKYIAEEIENISIRAGEEDSLAISVREDGMEAVITIGKEERISREDLLKGLKRRGISKGICEDEIANIAAGNCQDTKVTIARGREPENGADGWYEYFFRTTVERAPKMLPDGSVDYQNTEWFERVEEGQKVAYYHAAQAGTDGFTVMGENLPARNGIEERMLAGKGFLLQPDKKTYIAAVSGKIELQENYMEISRLLVVNEVTISTGNINFDGSVYIKGNVGSGTYITATEDIIVDGYVEAAVIECEGNLTVRQGVNASGSGEIKVKKEANAKFFETSKVYAKEGIRANYSMNCELYTEGKIMVSGTKGGLVGGTAYAAKGIESYNVGNRTEIVTVLKLGINEKIKDKYIEMEGQIKEVKKELTIFQNAYADFQKKYPPEVRNTIDVFLKMEDAIFTKEEQLKQLCEEKQQMEEEGKQIKGVKAVIEGTLFEGVIFEINGTRWESIFADNVTVKRIGDKIAVYSNR